MDERFAVRRWSLPWLQPDLDNARFHILRQVFFTEAESPFPDPKGAEFPLSHEPVAKALTDREAVGDFTDRQELHFCSGFFLAFFSFFGFSVSCGYRCSLRFLLEKSAENYGATFNVMLALRTMVHFDDLDDDMPVMIDPDLAASWRNILRNAVKDAAQ